MIVLYEHKYPAISKGFINSTDLNEIIKRSLDFDNPIAKLSRLYKENPRDLRQFILLEVITPILKHYNSTTINDSNINNALELICKAGYYITLDDLILFKDNWLMGKYEIKYKFDITDFQESFYTYLDNRAEKLARYHQNKGREAVKIENNPNTEKVKEILNVLTKPKEKLPTLEDNKAMRDKLMAIHKEFKDLLSEQGREFNTGKQFVLINGKELDINEFIKLKI